MRSPRSSGGPAQLLLRSEPDREVWRSAPAAAVPLFATGMVASDSLDQFAVLRDGFLLRVPVSAAADTAPVQVLIHWKPRAPQ